MAASLATVAALESTTDVDVLRALCPSVTHARWAAVLLESGGLHGLLLKDDLALGALLPHRAVEALRAAFELTKRYTLTSDNRPKLDSPDVIFRHLRPQLAHLPVERFVLLSLNSRNALLATDVVAEGSVDQCHVDPRVVFRAAVARNASGLVLAHNHPSGSAEPSVLDVSLTRQLQTVAEAMCIKLLDHLVITATGYTSMLARGLLTPGGYR